MNARIIKETRSLLPVFCVMALACTAPWLVWSREAAGGVSLAAFTIFCLALGASCFGNEYQWRTMPLLLAQPVPRRKIWNEKMLVLGTMLALGLELFWLFVPVESDSYVFLILVPFGVLCTAPYMALKTKNTLIAAACTFGLPFGLCGALAFLWWLFGPFFFSLIRPAAIHLFTFLREHSPATFRLLVHALDDRPIFWIGIAAAIYCTVCYRLGYRAFIKLEAVDAQAKEITLPPRMEAMLAGPMNRLLPRYGGPWASLLRKELQIQKAAFVLAGVMCLVSILMALAWDVDHQELLAGMSVTPIAVLAFIIPMIVPGGSLAEERSWGVSDWQRALPVGARKQWAAKMIVVVFTSVLLGVVLPLILWISDGWVFHLPIGPGPLHFERPPVLPPPPDLLRGLLIAMDFTLGYMLLLGFGVFTSSLCANSTRAVIMNLGLMIGGGCIASGITSSVMTPLQMHYDYVFQLRHPVVPMTLPNGRTVYHGDSPPSIMGFIEGHPQTVWLIFGILLGLLLLLVLCLGYSNYRKGEPSPGRAWRQLAVVMGSTVAGALVYWAVLYWNMVGALFPGN